MIKKHSKHETIGFIYFTNLFTNVFKLEKKHKTYMECWDVFKKLNSRHEGNTSSVSNSQESTRKNPLT